MSKKPDGLKTTSMRRHREFSKNEDYLRGGYSTRADRAELKRHVDFQTWSSKRAKHRAQMRALHKDIKENGIKYELMPEAKPRVGFHDYYAALKARRIQRDRMTRKWRDEPAHPTCRWHRPSQHG